MEELNRKTIDRAVLVGLNADCFTKEETATETTLDELEALLNTAGGECAGKVLQNKHTPAPRSRRLVHRRGQGRGGPPARAGNGREHGHFRQ